MIPEPEKTPQVESAPSGVIQSCADSYTASYTRRKVGRPGLPNLGHKPAHPSPPWKKLVSVALGAIDGLVRDAALAAGVPLAEYVRRVLRAQLERDGLAVPPADKLMLHSHRRARGGLERRRKAQGPPGVEGVPVIAAIVDDRVLRDAEALAGASGMDVSGWAAVMLRAAVFRAKRERTALLKKKAAQGVYNQTPIQ